MQKQSKVYSN